MKKRKIKKVIFIGYTPLTISTEKNFYFNEILSQDLELEYWDLTEAFFPSFMFFDSIQRDYIKVFFNLNEVRQKLDFEKIEETLIIPIIGFEWRSLHLYYILYKYKSRIGFFARGMLPLSNINLKTKILSKIRFFLKPKAMYKLFLNQFTYFIRKRTLVGHYEVVFSAGSMAEKNFIAIADCIVRCNHFDYDDTFDVQQGFLNENIRYIVFLDEFLSGHPDIKILNINTVSENNYFYRMNALFHQIEQILGIKVIIASHPKANYDLKVFGNRKIIKHQTAELVRNADLILAHTSTSIGLGVIYNKPILLTYTQELKDLNSEYVDAIELFGKALNCQVINIDEVLDTNQQVYSQIEDIDISSYNAYLENYLTSNESKKIHTKQIFLNYLAKFEG